MKTFDDCEHRSASHGANACSISHGHRSPMTRDSELYNLYFILYTLLYDAAKNLDPYHHTIKYKDVMSYNAAVCCALDTAGTSTSVVNTVHFGSSGTRTNGIEVNWTFTNAEHAQIAFKCPRSICIEHVKVSLPCTCQRRHSGDSYANPASRR